LPFLHKQRQDRWVSHNVIWKVGNEIGTRYSYDIRSNVSSAYGHDVEPSKSRRRDRSAAQRLRQTAPSIVQVRTPENPPPWGFDARCPGWGMSGALSAASLRHVRRGNGWFAIGSAPKWRPR